MRVSHLASRLSPLTSADHPRRTAAGAAHLVDFFKKIRVRTVPCDPPLGLSRGWVASCLRDMLFRRPIDLFSPRRWRTLLDAVRFNHMALDLLLLLVARDKTAQSDLTIGQWLADNGFSDAFRDQCLLPMMAALLSTGTGQDALRFPAAVLARRLWEDHLVCSLAEMGEQPSWRALADGSSSYVQAVMRGFPPNHLFLNTTVKRIRSSSTSTCGGRAVLLKLDNGTVAEYDHVILACDGQRAFEMIKDAGTPLEREILSGFEAVVNVAVLHSDTTLKPRQGEAWTTAAVSSLSSPSLFHHAGGKARSSSSLTLTYNLNMLQAIPEDTFGHVLLTLNPAPSHEPDPATVQGRFTLRSTAVTPASASAQARLELIQNRRGISYAGGNMVQTQQPAR